MSFYENRNTKVWVDNGHYAVQLHDTVIYDETKKSITLDHGGFVTTLTARRMNEVLDHREVMGHVTMQHGKMFFNDAPFTEGKFIAYKVGA